MPDNKSVSACQKALDQCFAASRVLSQFTGDHDEFGARDRRGNVRSIRRKDLLYIFVQERSPYVVLNPNMHYVGLTQKIDDGFITPLKKEDMAVFTPLLEKAFVEMTKLIVEQMNGVLIAR